MANLFIKKNKTSCKKISITLISFKRKKSKIKIIQKKLKIKITKELKIKIAVEIKIKKKIYN